MKSTLERELKVPETVEMEANGTSFLVKRLLFPYGRSVSLARASILVGVLEEKL